MLEVADMGWAGNEGMVEEEVDAVGAVEGEGVESFLRDQRFLNAF